MVVIWLRKPQQIVIDRKIQSFASLHNLVSEKSVLYLVRLVTLFPTEKLLPHVEPRCCYQVVKQRLVASLDRRCVFEDFFVRTVVVFAPFCYVLAFVPVSRLEARAHKVINLEGPSLERPRCGRLFVTRCSLMVTTGSRLAIPSLG